MLPASPPSSPVESTPPAASGERVLQPAGRERTGCRPLLGGRPRLPRDAGLGVCGPRRRPSLPARLLTAGPRRRPTRRTSAGGRARGPGLLREALQSGGLPNGGKAQARIRTRERARGRRTGGPGLTGSEFGDARPSARANQIAGRGMHLCRECVGAPSPRR